jgi:putative ABC transport system permease protein
MVMPRSLGHARTSCSCSQVPRWRVSVDGQIVTGWATAQDAKRPTALARALGGTARQVSSGLCAAQMLPALPGALIGIPLGIALFAAANSGGVVSVPPAVSLLAVVLGTLVAVAGLTSLPASIGASQPVAPILQAEDP